MIFEIELIHNRRPQKIQTTILSSERAQYVSDGCQPIDFATKQPSAVSAAYIFPISQKIKNPNAP